MRVEREGSLATITLDSPPLNLFDQAMIDGVRAAVQDVAADHPRGLLIRAEGKIVSGGVNVNLFDGLSVPEVAHVLDRTVHATEALLVRARAAFRAAYEGGADA